MIEIDDKIVSADLLHECFACDLAACKGACCVEGNAGAPLEADEVDVLEREYEAYKPYLTPEGIAAIERQGFMVIDDDGDYTTPLIDMPNAPIRAARTASRSAPSKRLGKKVEQLFANPFRATSIRYGSSGSRTEPRASTTIGGRYAKRPAPAANGWAYRFTKLCANRSSGVSAKSFIKRSKPPQTICIRNKTI